MCNETQKDLYTKQQKNAFSCSISMAVVGKIIHDIWLAVLTET